MWKDQSSFSRGDKDRTPKTWEFTSHGVRLVVTRHIDYPGVWIARCDPWFSILELKSTDIEKAKKEAISIVCGCLRKVINGFTS